MGSNVLLNAIFDPNRKGDQILNPSEVAGNIRDLIVHLTRSNARQSESIVEAVGRCLNGILKSGEDPGSAPMQRAQQTMFAIDEVRILLAQKDYTGAVGAARDARKEWSNGSPTVIEKRRP